MGLRYRKERDRLFQEQGGKCCYCKRDMLHWKVVDHNKRPLPPLTATLEHLIDRWDPRRGDPAFEGPVFAIACLDCNNKRGQHREKEAKAKVKSAFLASQQTGVVSRAVFRRGVFRRPHAIVTVSRNREGGPVNIEVFDPLYARRQRYTTGETQSPALLAERMKEAGLTEGG